MEEIEIIVSDYPDRDSVPVEFKHTGDGIWEADLGSGFEKYADFETEPETESEHNTQARTVQQLLRKEFDVTYGGTPTDLVKYND